MAVNTYDIICTMGTKKTNLTIEGLEKAGFTGPEAVLSALMVIDKVWAGEEDLESIIEAALASPSPDEALLNLSALLEADNRATISELTGIPGALAGLIFLLGASPFLTRILLSKKSLLRRLFIEDDLHECKDEVRFLSEIRAAVKKKDQDEGIIKKILRLYKEGEFLRLGARDLLGLAAMSETTAELSALAGAMLEVAIEESLTGLTERFGAPAGGSGFAVIGLGKLGGNELNYSSDIDIMYVFEEGESGEQGSSISAGEFYTRLAQRVTKLIGELTAEGLVFRVDLDLRPGGRSGALVQSMGGAESYYESQGREWERAAMIKARCVAGDRAVGEAFIKMIEPFVYRRNLDFTAIEEIKTMKENINLAAAKRGDAAGETNVKLGRGGIREIEFFVQTMQLIHGGRDKELRLHGTLQTLQVLAGKGLISSGDETSLKEAYVYLRNLEHRLQIIECRQTHTLRHGGEEETRVARMMGFIETEPFIRELRRITGSVYEVFRGLFYSPSSADEPNKNIIALFTPETDEKERMELLHEMGFKDAKRALGNVKLLRDGPPGLRRTSARGRAVFERAAPFLLSKVLTAPNPDMALNHLEKFIAKAGARSAQYALLVENPDIADKLLHIFGTSDFLSKSITDRPENIDFLLRRELSGPVKTKEEFLSEFSGKVLSKDQDLEGALDAMRQVRNSEVLRIGLNHLSGAISPVEVSGQMTDLAEAALQSAWQVSARELEKRYTAPKGAKFAVIGLGKLGARELGYGSDLDIVFIYEPGEDENKEKREGETCISEHEFFVKLCQRIISALTVKTREGSVFEVDTRLRPSGSAGPLVIARPTFIKYHSGSTALWERQAFIRARHVAGDKGLGKKAVAEVQELIYSRPLIKADITKMLEIRERMEVEIAKETDERYNFKTGRGALVDIEFLTQAIQLCHGGEDKTLRLPGTIAALEAIVKGSYMDEADYRFLREAYGFLRSIEFAERIMFNRSETFLTKNRSKAAPLARSLGYTEESADEQGRGAEAEGGKLLDDYAEITSGVRKIYKKILHGLA